MEADSAPVTPRREGHGFAVGQDMVTDGTKHGETAPCEGAEHGTPATGVKEAGGRLLVPESGDDSRSGA